MDSSPNFQRLSGRKALSSLETLFGWIVGTENPRHKKEGDPSTLRVVLSHEQKSP